MELYALYKDGELYRASYDQNVPFYFGIEGAKRALQNVTNIRSVPYYMENATIIEKRAYLEELKTHFKIRKFTLVEEGEIC